MIYIQIKLLVCTLVIVPGSMKCWHGSISVFQVFSNIIFILEFPHAARQNYSSILTFNPQTSSVPYSITYLHPFPLSTQLWAILPQAVPHNSPSLLTWKIKKQPLFPWADFTFCSQPMAVDLQLHFASEISYSIVNSWPLIFRSVGFFHLASWLQWSFLPHPCSFTASSLSLLYVPQPHLYLASSSPCLCDSSSSYLSPVSAHPIHWNILSCFVEY